MPRHVVDCFAASFEPPTTVPTLVELCSNAMGKWEEFDPIRELDIPVDLQDYLMEEGKECDQCGRRFYHKGGRRATSEAWYGAMLFKFSTLCLAPCHPNEEH